MSSKHITITTPSKQATQAAHRINKLWDKVQRKQRQNAKFKAQMDELVQFINNDMYQVGCDDIVPAQQALAERLQGFLTRKTLREHEREFLCDWLCDICTDCANYRPDISDQIQARTRSIISETKGEEVAYIWFGPSAEDVQRSRQDEAEAEAEQEAEFDSFEFEFESGADNDDIYDDGLDSALHTELSGEKAQRQWLQKLYRRTANVLHPDKQRDPEKAAQQQKIMHELNKARRHNDTATLVSLYVEHVLGSEAWTPEHEDIAHLEALLHIQLDRLGGFKDSIIQQHPVYAMAYELLYDRSGKKVAANKANRLRDMKEFAALCRQREQTLTSLAKLRAYIQVEHEMESGEAVNALNTLIDAMIADGMSDDEVSALLEMLDESETPEAFFECVERVYGPHR